MGNIHCCWTMLFMFLELTLRVFVNNKMENLKYFSSEQAKECWFYIFVFPDQSFLIVCTWGNYSWSDLLVSLLIQMVCLTKLLWPGRFKDCTFHRKFGYNLQGIGSYLLFQSFSACFIWYSIAATYALMLFKLSLFPL